MLIYFIYLSVDRFVCMLQYERIKSVLKLMSKPSLAEQAGRMAVENCIIVLLLSLAAVSIYMINLINN